jgi:hypothetical protein
VAHHLGRSGLTARRLGDVELAQLYMACWAPERARLQRVRQRLVDYTTLAVGTASASTPDDVEPGRAGPSRGG